MGKKKKNVEETDAAKNNGCICPLPNGCRQGSIDPLQTNDVVKFLCSNSTKCTENLLLHAKCVEEWQEILVRQLGKHRARKEGKIEHYCSLNINYLWAKETYSKIINKCKCPCGGFLKKDVDEEIRVEPKKLVDQTNRKPKKNLPKLNALPRTTKSIQGHYQPSVRPQRLSALNTVRDDDENFICGLYTTGDDKKYSRKVNTTVPTFHTMSVINAPKSMQHESLNDESQVYEMFVEFFDNFSGDMYEIGRFVNHVLAKCDENLIDSLCQSGDIWCWLNNRKEIWGIEIDFLRLKDQISENGIDFYPVEERQNESDQEVDGYETASENIKSSTKNTIRHQKLIGILPNHSNSIIGAKICSNFDVVEKFSVFPSSTIDQASIYKETLEHVESLVRMLYTNR
uniref:Headcase middle domain-containing protein n=1 Tax=Romanomermis culicivorax TaxID=13658 RepID=A0A915JM86_ROMCU